MGGNVFFVAFSFFGVILVSWSPSSSPAGPPVLLDLLSSSLLDHLSSSLLVLWSSGRSIQKSQQHPSCGGPCTFTSRKYGKRHGKGRYSCKSRTLQVACEMDLYKQRNLYLLNFAYDLQSTSICAIFCASTGAVLVNVHYTFVVLLLVLILLAVLLVLERLKGSPLKKYTAKQFHTHLSIATGYTDKVFIHRGYV